MLEVCEPSRRSPVSGARRGFEVAALSSGARVSHPFQMDVRSRLSPQSRCSGAVQRPLSTQKEHLTDFLVAIRSHATPLCWFAPMTLTFTSEAGRNLCE